MALRARAESPDQGKLHVDRSSNGRNFDDLLDLVPDAERVEDSDCVARIRVELAAERAVAVEVVGREWMYLPPVVRARDSSGTPWNDDGRVFLHVVVFYGVQEAQGIFMPDDELLCLDPFFPLGVQPLRLTLGELRRACGRAIVL